MRNSVARTSVAASAGDDLVQLARDEAREPGGRDQARGDAEDDRPQAIAEDHPHHGGAARAEGHADADLARPSLGAAGDDAVEADRRQQQRDTAEETRQRRDQPLLREVLVHQVGEEADLHRQVPVDRLDFCANCRRQVRGIAGGAHMKGPLAARPLRLVHHEVDRVRRGRAKGPVFRVRDDADDLDVLVAGDFDEPANRIGSVEVVAGDGLVDDRDPGRSRPIVRREITAAPDRDTHRLEKPRPDDFDARLPGLAGPLHGEAIDELAAKQRRIGQGGRAHAGQSRHAPKQVGVEDAGAFGRVTTETGIECGQKHVVATEPGIHRTQIAAGADEEAAGDEQDQRRRPDRDQEFAQAPA